MKRRVLLLLAVLMVVPSIVLGGMTIVKKKTSGDSCTGDLLFSAHFENNDDVTVGTPAGCSAGADSTFALTGATYSSSNVNDGTYAMLLDNANDVAEITITGDDIGSDTAGRVDMYVYFPTSVADGTVFQIYGGLTDYINIVVVSNEFRLRHKGSNNTIQVLTTGCDLTTSVWYHVIGRWRTGDTNPSLSISCTADTVTTDDNISAFTEQPNVMKVGEGGEASTLCVVDSLKVYNAYE